MDPIDIDVSLPFSVIRLANLFGRNFYQNQTKAKHGLSLSEWRIMMTLACHPGISAIEVCHFTGYTEVNMSRALKRLKAAGRVRSERDTKDRRRTKLDLTPEGVELYERLRPMATASISGLASDLTPAERKQLRRFLGLLTEKMIEVTTAK